MMKKTFGTALMGVAALSSVSAFAEGIPGAYATLRAGYKTMGFAHNSDYLTDKLGIDKATKIAISGRAGLDVSVGWQIDPMFSAEIAGYTDLLGNASAATDIAAKQLEVKKPDGSPDGKKDGTFKDFSVTQRAVAILGKVTVPMVDDVNFMLKGGVAYLFSQESGIFTPTPATGGTSVAEKTPRTAVQNRFAIEGSVGVNYTLSEDILSIPATVGGSVTCIYPINLKDTVELSPIVFASAEITVYFG